MEPGSVRYRFRVLLPDGREYASDLAHALAPAAEAPPGSTPSAGSTQPILASTSMAMPVEDVRIELGADRTRILPGESVKLSWTVQGDVAALKLFPAPGAPLGFNPDLLPWEPNRSPGGSATLTIEEADAAASPDRKIYFVLSAAVAGGVAVPPSQVVIEVAPQLTYELRSLALAHEPLVSWMADPHAAPFKEGPIAEDAACCIRYALWANGATDCSLRTDFNASLTTYVKNFQHSQLDSTVPESRFSALGRKRSDLQETGQFDRLTAALLDIALLEKRNLPAAAWSYGPVRSANRTFTTGGPSSLAARCLSILRYWATTSNPNDPDATDAAGNAPYVKYAGGFPLAVLFGKWAWFPATGSPNDVAHWQTVCTCSTISAFMAATKGRVRGAGGAQVDLALDPNAKDYYKKWQIMLPRRDCPAGCAGVIAELGVGDKVDLTPDEENAVDDEVAALPAAQRPARKKDLRRQRLLEKTQPGDIVQGWASEDVADGVGHSYFITGPLQYDASGKPTKYPILSANAGIPPHYKRGVCESQIQWDFYKELHVARFYRIEGE